jgi:hypothetical protein
MIRPQVDDAADRGVGVRDGARLREADDLLNLRDRQAVLLLAEREDDKLHFGTSLCSSARIVRALPLSLSGAGS